MPKLRDLSNQTFGLLTVLRRAEDLVYPSKDRRSGQRLTAWICKCQCGNLRIVRGTSLRDGKIVSCGCKYVNKRKNKLVGRRFGRLIVYQRAPDRNKHSYWICKCDCGADSIVLGNHLISGATKSCGCLWRERRLEFGLAMKRAKYRLAKIHALKRRRSKNSEKSLDFSNQSKNERSVKDFLDHARKIVEHQDRLALMSV